MAKLTKKQVRDHEQACEILAGDKVLMDDEVFFVIDNWHEGAEHSNAKASAHFTPYDLAAHAALEVQPRKILDLCAGIGTLSVAVHHHFRASREIELTLVEINPDYAAIAQKLLPGAEVIVGSMYDTGLTKELASRNFDTCLSNPPFGSFSKNGGKAPRYIGSDAHYDAIDIASDLAKTGVFILPQTAVPFRLSGCSGFERMPKGHNLKYDRFAEQTFVNLEPNIGIDTSVLPGFRDVNIITEIATADFEMTRRLRLEAEAPAHSDQYNLFQLAA